MKYKKKIIGEIRRKVEPNCFDEEDQPKSLEWKE